MRLYRMIIASVAVLVLCSFSALEKTEEPLKQIWKHGVALNIEGGVIPQQHLKPSQIWASLCFILDRPFYDGVELKDITKNNAYPLKEGNILAYNERKAALATALVLKYYIHNAHKLAALPASEPVNVIVQVHRNSTGAAHVQFLEELLQLIGEEMSPLGSGGLEIKRLAFPQHKAIFELRYGVSPTSYEGAHIVLSIGAAAGLHPDLESGSILLPYRFVPFDLQEMELELNQSYEVKNHLIGVLGQLVPLQNEQLLIAINRQFASPNPAKARELAVPLTSEDFYKCTLLQVNKLFNPSQMPQEVSVYK